MKTGRFTVEQLSEGRFELYKNGRYQRVDPGSDDTTSLSESIRKTGRVMGIGPVLIADEKYRILLDTGLGWGMDAGSTYSDISNVRTNLEIFDLKPEEITHVILSHLHYDHAAGCTYVDEASRTRPTFSDATYYLHREEWDFALARSDSPRTSAPANEYNLDEFYRLVADDRVEFLTSDHLEIVPGIDLIKTGGHTPGHLAVKITDGRKPTYYLGDLLPTEEELNNMSVQRRDHDPVQAKKMKIRLLRKAFEEKAAILFYHSLYSKVGRLEQDEDKNYVLREL